jgi:isoleucyl-tRNA synthetase
MSKRLNNYPELLDTVNKFSADALRYFLISSPAVRAEEVAFSEKGLDEVTKKVLNRLQNVTAFYELYKDQAVSVQRLEVSENLLDKWIIARLDELIEGETTGLDNYALDKASRPIADFIDDLSTWYLRRSRERFKSENEDDKQSALSTIRLVLKELSKLMAPFTPFIAEDIYQRMKSSEGKESVHLESWPLRSKSDEASTMWVLNGMTETRKIVTLALEARAKAGIKVRQPLRSLRIKNNILGGEFLNLIKEEVNIKNVDVDETLETEVDLDTKIDPELKEEGLARELMRALQDLRKSVGLQVGEKATLSVSTGEAGRVLIEDFDDEISKVAGLSKIDFADNDGAETKIDNLTFKLKLTPNSQSTNT